jgi:hypothetical protein
MGCCLLTEALPPQLKLKAHEKTRQSKGASQEALAARTLGGTIGRPGRASLTSTKPQQVNSTLLPPHRHHEAIERPGCVSHEALSELGSLSLQTHRLHPSIDRTADCPAAGDTTGCPNHPDGQAHYKCPGRKVRINSMVVRC